ncbi:MAG: hypothetical protein SFZ24_09490 [Planctomycetota bacterium]|nr:hypothetical protein [Planctomycetota bacterium]
MNAQRAPHAGAAQRKAALLVILCVLAAALALATISVRPILAGPAAVVLAISGPGLLAAAWLAAASGFGSLLAPTAAWPVRTAAGIALMLVLARCLGSLGLLRATPWSCALAWAPLIVGIAILALHLARRASRRLSSDDAPQPDSPRAPAHHVWWLLPALPACAVMLVAACTPPGTLWRSEALGFDVLSYHLQLPRQWLQQGRAEPLAMNAYSWLPSYVECAYTHLGALIAPRGSDPFTSRDGPATIAAALLHAGIMIIAALALAAAARALGARPAAATLGAAALLATPWTVVTGSLAYNEAAVIAGAAASLALAASSRPDPLRRGLLIGLIMGAACGSKLTAAYSALPAVAIALLALTPPAQLPRIMLAACAAGLAALAPWLIHHAIHSGGNPVFPFAASILGGAEPAHPLGINLDRWNTGHHATGNLLHRAALLFSDRGVLHPQWSILLPLALASGLALAPRRATRLHALLFLAIIIIQFAAWILLGHQQSRFLLPCAVPASIMLALAIRGRAACILGAIAVLILSASTFRVWFSEHRGHPNLALVGGVAALTGELMRPLPTGAEGAALRDALPPPAYINLTLDPAQTRLLLLGDSTPFYYRVPIEYWTTWNSSRPALHAAQTPDLLAALRNLEGLTHVLVNLDEIARLTREGWYDPALTPDAAHRLVTDAAGAVVRSWTLPGMRGSYLIDLRQSSTSARPAPAPPPIGTRP